MVNRTQPPEFRPVEQIHLIKPHRVDLKNGCRIFVFDSGDQDLVRIEWIFRNLRFNPEKPLLNVAVNTMLTEGTATRSASGIAGEIDFYGGFLQVDYGYDHSQAALYTLNRHLAKTLPVMKDMITASVFPERELQTYSRNQQQKLQVSLKKNDMVARRLFNKAIYGSTIYGLAAECDDYKALRREDLLAHFREMYQPANCTVIVAGKVDDATLRLITSAFEDWEGTGLVADISQPAVQPAAEHRYFTEKSDALQSAIRMGLPSVTRVHSDFPALQVLNTVLGGYFGSRLMRNIREEKGYTYGIGSGLSSLSHGGALFISSEVGADVCRAAVHEIEKEIRLLHSDPVPEHELSLVRNYMMGSLLGSLENVFSHADKFKNIYFSGLGYEYFDRYTKVVKTVQADELLELARKYLDLDQFYRVIVGKF